LLAVIMTYIREEERDKKTLKFLMQQIKHTQIKYNSPPPNFNLYTTEK
jgi:hypothetical protein